MKKNMMKALSLVIILVAAVSCNKQPSKMDGGTGADGAAASQGLTIAYVNMDSVQNNYKLCEFINDSLQNMDMRRQKVLNDYSLRLQRSANSIQTKLQNNGFTSEEQAKNAMAAYQQEENNFTSLQARLGKELEDKAQELQKILLDSLNNFIADYNKDKKFDFILRNEIVLHADKKYDVTQDVINGLNKRFKK